MDNGWIKIHRKLKDSPVFQNESLLKMWIWCLLKASHCERDTVVGLQEIRVEQGSFIFGRKKAAQELGTKEATCYRHLKLLESMHMIELKSNNKFTVVTVENWALYQQDEQENNNKRATNEQQMSSKRTTNEHKQELKELKNIYNADLDEIWKAYPRKEGKADTYKKLPKILKDYSKEEILRSIKRYQDSVSDKKFLMHGSTFFNGRYVDYLDANYEDKPQEPVKPVGYHEQIRLMNGGGKCHQ